jgi:hypothetical protein
MLSLYEKVTKNEEDSEQELKEARHIAQLELGDIFERFINGDMDALDSIFDISLDKQGKVRFKVKKKLTPTEKCEAFLILLTQMKKQRVFVIGT